MLRFLWVFGLDLVSQMILVNLTMWGIIADPPGIVEQQLLYLRGRLIDLSNFCGHMIVDHPNEFITAVATCTVAAFTIVLARSTTRLWQATWAAAANAHNIQPSTAIAARARDMQASTAVSRQSADIAEKTLINLDIPYVYPVELTYSPISAGPGSDENKISFC